MKRSLFLVVLLMFALVSQAFALGPLANGTNKVAVGVESEYALWASEAPGRKASNLAVFNVGPAVTFQLPDWGTKLVLKGFYSSINVNDNFIVGSESKDFKDSGIGAVSAELSQALKLPWWNLKVGAIGEYTRYFQDFEQTEHYAVLGMDLALTSQLYQTQTWKAGGLLQWQPVEKFLLYAGGGWKGVISEGRAIATLDGREIYRAEGTDHGKGKNFLIVGTQVKLFDKLALGVNYQSHLDSGYAIGGSLNWNF